VRRFHLGLRDEEFEEEDVEFAPFEFGAAFSLADVWVNEKHAGQFMGALYSAAFFEKDPVKIIESREVDPSLGKDTIRSAIKASVIGVIAVAVFMLVYYLLAGVVANIALMLNIIVLLGIMCYFHTTFTLPGIAGVVLTIGMAVDTNILIFERIREELRSGKTVRAAIDSGFARAFRTVIDTHVTVLVSAAILYQFGTGPVKGFAVTLAIGLLASLFTAVFFTRLVFDLMYMRGRKVESISI
jgi:preprotein translocase subunit SecD